MRRFSVGIRWHEPRTATCTQQARQSGLFFHAATAGSPADLSDATATICRNGACTSAAFSGLAVAVRRTSSTMATSIG